MLSYPDSKRLKELGYPQELKEGDWVYLVIVSTEERFLFDQNLKDAWLRKGGWAEDDYVKVPTTDGMIEGLGGDFYGVVQETRKRRLTYDAYGHKLSDSHVIEECKAPEQALCELWKKVKEKNA